MGRKVIDPLSTLPSREVSLSRQLLCSVALVLVGFQPVRASTVVVPDAFSTVQSAIDSGADTVLIREGTYAERPVVDHAVVLQGIGVAQRPRLAGLAIFNSYFWAFPPLLSVDRIDFSGRVEHTTLYYRPRSLLFSFSDCSLDSGFYQVVSLDPNDVDRLTLRRCHLGAASNARIFRVIMEADTIDGSVYWTLTHQDRISDCWFRGGPDGAITLNQSVSDTLANNRIDHYLTGISVSDGDDTVVDANELTNCEVGIQYPGGGPVYITNNLIRDCGVGINAYGDDRQLVGNSIIRARGDGIQSGGAELLIQGNVVGSCGGSGLLINGATIRGWVKD